METCQQQPRHLALGVCAAESLLLRVRRIARDNAFIFVAQEQ